MPAEFVPVPPFDLTIFGGTGDLAACKLLPALYHRDRDGQLSQDSRIIGVSRADMSDNDYAAWVYEALADHLAEDGVDEVVWQRFASRLCFAHVDVKDQETWPNLAERWANDDDNARVRVFYLATSARLFGEIAHQLDAGGLVTADARIVLEKPVGADQASAREINAAVGAVFDESSIFRIDHYLGKEAVQNLLALRFGNAIFEPLWHRTEVDHVQITVAEAIGVDSRLEFYERTGALRDMVQNHMLQLLCLVAMEPPASMHHDDIRDEKMKVLRALHPITRDDARTTTVRGQYTSGMVDGEPVAAYDSDGLEQSPQAETFTAIKAELDNWRWQGTPFYLRTGKRMARKSSKIVFQFKPVPHSIFGDQRLAPNQLTLTLQPEEGVQLSLMTKDPGPGGFFMTSVPLNLSFSDQFDVRYPDAYERLLMDVMRGNPALFMRRDEVEAAWAWTDSIIESWHQARIEPQSYMAGTWGPPDAFLLIDRDGRRWRDE